MMGCENSRAVLVGKGEDVCDTYVYRQDADFRNVSLKLGVVNRDAQTDRLDMQLAPFVKMEPVQVTAGPHEQIAASTRVWCDGASLRALVIRREVPRVIGGGKRVSAGTQHIGAPGSGFFGRASGKPLSKSRKEAPCRSVAPPDGDQQHAD